jgi:hypothetical protein
MMLGVEEGAGAYTNDLYMMIASTYSSAPPGPVFSLPA